MFADWQAADRQLYLPAGSDRQLYLPAERADLQLELTSAGPPGPPAGDRRLLTRTSQLLQLLVGPNQLPSKLGILKYGENIQITFTYRNILLPAGVMY